MTIEEIYQQKRNTPSDINCLLEYLKEYAGKCDFITEFGVRDPTSTYAFLAAYPKRLTSYDIIKHENVWKAERYDNFEFILGSTLEVEIEETDMLFIDTHHTAQQVANELALHADKVRKYIGFHDWFTFRNRDESAYKDQPQEVYGIGPGIGVAIDDFLAKGTFRKVFETDINNGLLIIERF